MTGSQNAPGEAAWAGYYRWNADRPVRDLLLRALAAYGRVDEGAVAVDVGSGSGQETRALLDAGFTVTAPRLDRLVAGLEVLELTEVDEDGRAYAGPKHWHRFELVARRPVVA